MKGQPVRPALCYRTHRLDRYLGVGASARIRAPAGKEPRKWTTASAAGINSTAAGRTAPPSTLSKVQLPRAPLRKADKGAQ